MRLSENTSWESPLKASMRRYTLAAIAAISFLTATLPDAHAEEIIIQAVVGDAEDEEAIVLLWKDTDTGETWVEAIYKDGGNMIWLNNPNPDTGETTPGDEGSQKALAKQAGGRGYLVPAWQNTPLGQFVGDIGPGNYHNPSDDDDYGGQSNSNSSFRSPSDISEEMYAGGGVGGIGGFNFNGGAVGQQLADAIRRGKKGGGGDGGDDRDPPQGSGIWDDEMPGPPELVNPATHDADGLLFLLLLH